ncbi:hypothetical protein B0J15DRAFT_590963 [Fusarium solani]|uniref:Uncharacterized protein n=1 Tax=Fusarium solani TaxID=169388 RepID=A0A9P9RA55_FUSSL|nr:uncharacterized protein B0J15DRAFT_590963 [Fusarium solani]KAH7270968.1 hypothetical protein B0J15DRAFT_590963 [Fusarium solani]
MDRFDEFQQLLHSFRCERLPLDLFTRATAEMSSWSPSGEITSVSPQRHGVPLWFIDFWVSHSHRFEQDGPITGLKGFYMVSEGGFRYLERREEDPVFQPDNAADQRVCLAECLAIMVHAFPCINSEVLGEELVSMFMPLAKTFLLPLLAAVTGQDVDDWLLPRSDELKIQFAYSLSDMLHQIVPYLGVGGPSVLTTFPERLLSSLDRQGLCFYQDKVLLGCLVGIIDVHRCRTLNSFLASTLQNARRVNQRCNAWIGLSLAILLSAKGLLSSKPLTDAISVAMDTWKPLSQDSPSRMEYLVAVDILSTQQLSQVHRPVPMPLELDILCGLLLARKGAYLDAHNSLKAAMPSAIQTWGATSLQVGIMAAESANCCNVVRSEALAERIAGRFLELRTTQELSTRRDWFYLRVALIDSHIGQAKYQEADRELAGVLEHSYTPDTIRMMSCLRLAKVRRRMERGGREAFRASAPLQAGAALLKQAPKVLQREFLEETACNLAAIPEAERKEAPEPTELIKNVDEFIQESETGLQTPSMAWYKKLWRDFKPNTPETPEHLRDGLLELPEEDLDNPLTPGHVEAITELLRKKFRRDMLLHYVDGSPSLSQEQIERIMEEADAIYAEVNRRIESWSELPRQLHETDAERYELEEVLRYWMS